MSDSDPDSDQRTAVVTGGAAGIGRAIARRLAADGAHVVVVDVADGDETVAAIEAEGGSAEYRAGDVTDPDSMAAAFEGLSLDVLVNNAAYYAPLVNDKKRFDEIPPDEWDAVMDVNAKGVYLASSAALPRFGGAGEEAEAEGERTGDGGGQIVNISSTTAVKGTPGFLHYVASKAAVLGMTRAMAAELGDLDIRVNAVLPGFTASEASKQAGEEYLDARVTDQAIRRPIEPRNVADAVAFLAGPDSAMVSGQALTVDGGKTFY